MAREIMSTILVILVALLILALLRISILLREIKKLKSKDDAFNNTKYQHAIDILRNAHYSNYINSEIIPKYLDGVENNNSMISMHVANEVREYITNINPKINSKEFNDDSFFNEIDHRINLVLSLKDTGEYKDTDTTKLKYDIKNDVVKSPDGGTHMIDLFKDSNLNDF